VPGSGRPFLTTNGKVEDGLVARYDEAGAEAFWKSVAEGMRKVLSKRCVEDNQRNLRGMGRHALTDEKLKVKLGKQLAARAQALRDERTHGAVSL
jgi:hypothetical protein